MSSSKPLILALGNPILTDDRAGLDVARALAQRLPADAVELTEVSVGGVELLHFLEGHRRVLLLDALEPGLPTRGKLIPGELGPGEVEELALTDLAHTSPPLTPHNAGLLDCLALGRLCGLEMPDEILIYAIGVSDPYTFGERCTPAVEAAVPRIVERVWADVFGPGGRWARPLDG
jgi:hydrogenase maturation protease